MTISILGSGWLGLPLAQHFVEAGHIVKASTTSENRLPKIESIGAAPSIVNIDSLTNDIKTFLEASILIVNIPSKNVEGFRALVHEIETSKIERVLFISSTSVYQNIN
ncbi:MAG: SDR family NAD(P)-dependent oxidoreductase, partial [Chloroflexota bacterium]